MRLPFLQVFSIAQGGWGLYHIKELLLDLNNVSGCLHVVCLCGALREGFSVIGEKKSVLVTSCAMSGAVRALVIQHNLMKN